MTRGDHSWGRLAQQGWQFLTGDQAAWTARYCPFLPPSNFAMTCPFAQILPDLSQKVGKEADTLS